MKNLHGIVLASAQAMTVFLAVSLEANSQAIENRDVYLVANELADEVELIREVMGRPYDDSPRLPVAGVSIFEVYFQAQTLFRKANQLARELADAQLEIPPRAPAGQITAADMYPLVERALEQVRIVKVELGIEEQVAQQERSAPISPTGVFSVVVDANRQLNLLLSNTIRSADVYEEVTFGVIYAAGMLASRAGIRQIPQPAFEGYKRPADVYARVLECIDIVASIAPRVGIEVVSLSSRRNVPDDVEPGHVYDVARILVADLALLATALEAERIDANLGPTPKHIFPAHVYQRAGILKAQLEMLAASF